MPACEPAVVQPDNWAQLPNKQYCTSYGLFRPNPLVIFMYPLLVKKAVNIPIPCVVFNAKFFVTNIDIERTAC